MVDETDWDLDVKLRITCWGCGMPAHTAEECVLRKGRWHICLGDPEGTRLCSGRIAEQFLSIELRRLYPGGYPPGKWLFVYNTISIGRISWG